MSTGANTECYACHVPVAFGEAYEKLRARLAEVERDLRQMRIGREEDDLAWRKLWENEKARAERAEAEVGRLRKAMQYVVDSLPCRCHVGFTSRQLQDPACPCDDIQVLRDALAAHAQGAERKEEP